MNQKKYDVKASSELEEYYFTCSGKNGNVLKVIQYVPVAGNIYNLAFGVSLSNGRIDDKVVSNNGDMNKTLVTVATTVLDFTDKNPDALILAQGSTAARTRLYRKMICLNLEEISENFMVFGNKDDVWEPFVSNSNYKAFLVKRKIKINFGEVREVQEKFELMKTKKVITRKTMGMNVTIDPALDQFSGVILFKEKVEAAKQLLKTSPVPKELI
ncbi:MAG: hypothetical protein K0S32_614 [Bacteroidetes bacterium]|jgi:hypothetical protein|nr:hypothetical protein [Bacteroidota bacterium]